ncbi:hypothetical protein XYCOK13_43470 [Xylanibacillus composti]|uniref:Uncharacterized protein n=1 Tax=Xylanibacillus composti TaxID=1572762 RepID=A0A8J4H9N5_9BACL|nr:hypothetical protein XYCOK13_43470 [Xylanibacillus composti]
MYNNLTIAARPISKVRPGMPDLSYKERHEGRAYFIWTVRPSAYLYDFSHKISLIWYNQLLLNDISNKDETLPGTDVSFV